MEPQRQPQREQHQNPNYWKMSRVTLMPKLGTKIIWDKILRLWSVGWTNLRCCSLSGSVICEGLAAEPVLEVSSAVLFNSHNSTCLLSSSQKLRSGRVPPRPRLSSATPMLFQRTSAGGGDFTLPIHIEEANGGDDYRRSRYREASWAPSRHRQLLRVGSLRGVVGI